MIIIKISLAYQLFRFSEHAADAFHIHAQQYPSVGFDIERFALFI